MDKYDVLKQYFGHSSFRDGQETLVNALLNGEDALGIMPTGAGKSVCYQVPALLLPGITLVISPLISLMKDQVAALISAGVPAAYLNTSLTPAQLETATTRAAQGTYKIIYVAPERLDTTSFRRFAQNAAISLLAVDEAHFVSQWGQDFRPSYLRIADFCSSLPHRPLIGAFTATATQRVRQDIVRLLCLNHPRTVVTGFDRPNLYFEVLRPRDKKAALTEILARQEGRCGIVYCATRKTVEQVAALLDAKGFSVGRYHAGLSAEERRMSQEDFQYDRIQVIVATNAFGMGIDKPNVRFVIHYNIPRSMEAYYQEAGRAGRDGDPAECVLLYSGQDMITARWMIEHSEVNEDLTPEEQTRKRSDDYRRLEQIASWAQGRSCLRAGFLRYFGQNAPDGCGHCSACLGPKYSFAAAQSGKAVRPAFGRQQSAAEANPWPDHDVPAWSGRRDSEDSNDTYLYSEKPELLPMKKGYRPGAGVMKEAESVNPELLEQLRRVRASLAGKLRMPAYIVCDDKALRDMAAKLPHTVEEMTEVYGFGTVKAKKYGPAFVKAISAWETASR